MGTIPDPSALPGGGGGLTPISYSLYGGANQTGSNTGQTGQASQQNQYTPQQQAAQGQLGNAYSGLVNGQVPTQFTAPPSVISAWNQAFQQNVAPGLAAQYGAGSPQIGAQQSYGLGQLLANQYQQGLSNYSGALAGLGSYAMSPIGATSANQTNQNYAGNATNEAGSLGSQAAWLSNLIQQLLGQPYGASAPTLAP